MKRLFVLFVVLFFLFTCSAFAGEATKAKPAVTAKEATMNATGKVTDISDTMLRIERTVGGKAEIMEFALEKTYPKIAAGDEVKVSYITKDGKNVSIKLTKKDLK